MKVARADRRNRMQCPKCREVVRFEMPAEAPGQSRIEALEARVAALEKIVADATRGASASGFAPKLKWLAAEAAPDLSDERADVLCHNLSAVAAHRIIIQSRPDDERARERAEWFKNVFERARWPVLGPEDAPAGLARGGLALATALPVSPEAAATFLAFRAAGFELAGAFDPELAGAEERLIVA